MIFRHLRINYELKVHWYHSDHDDDIGFQVMRIFQVVYNLLQNSENLDWPVNS